MINGIITAAKVLVSIFVIGIAIMLLIVFASYGAHKTDEVHQQIEEQK